MEINIKYPAPSSRSRNIPIHNELQKISVDSRWRESTTDVEIGQAILAHCRHSKHQLDSLLKA